MKTKPILFAIALTVLSSALFFQCKQQIDRKEDIVRFLTLFTLQVQGKQVDSLKNHFDMPQRRVAIAQLINLLCEKSGSGKGSKSIFKISLNTSDNDIKSVSDSVYTVTFSLIFSRDINNIQPKRAALTFRIKEVAARVFKITDVDARKFLEDYIAFENVVRENTLTDADIYSPQTLAAFKTADSLKARYDSIPWFQHIGTQTYYFVAKGRFDQLAILTPDSADNYKMGLLNPQLKEIIPVQYQLVHNIGATFPNLIEVETVDKRGFYDLTGQNVLPAIYDQIFPLTDDANLAVLRQGDNYFWWRKDHTVSEADPEIKIANVIKRVPKIVRNLNIDETFDKNIMEANSREDHGSIYLAPSYLVDLSLMRCLQSFKNPLRRNVGYYNANKLLQLRFKNNEDKGSWFTSAFYSVRDYFLDGRSEFYDSKRVMLVNNKTNRVYGAEVHAVYNEYNEGDAEALSGVCDVNTIDALNDTLYEAKTGTALYIQMYNEEVLTAAPMYHYLTLNGNKMEEKRTQRFFSFTKFVKMDDTHLSGCYEIQNKGRISAANVEMLRYMKNEIYADYAFDFKDKKWRDIFINHMSSYRYVDNDYKGNASVDDSLTAIDKYNIAFINQKLKELNNKNKVLASK